MPNRLDIDADLLTRVNKALDEIRAGKLKAKKLGSRTLITAPDAQAYLDTLPGMPPDA